MPAQNTSSSNKGRKINTFFLCFCMALLSMYPIYRNFYYSSGILSYERQIAILEKRSEFYNPWQYRILCPYTIEGMLWVYNRTVDRVYPIEKKLHASPQDNTDDKTGPSISGLEHTPEQSSI